MSMSVTVHIGAFKNEQHEITLRQYGKTADAPIHVEVRTGTTITNDADLVFYERAAAEEFVYQLADFLGIGAEQFINRAIERAEAQVELELEAVAEPEAF